MCKFCNLNDGSEVFESEHFRVIVSLGALVEGWLLVVPKQHMLALAEMNPELAAEYDSVANRFRSKLRLKFGAVAEFEHGPGECNSSAGCTIDHAQSHLVPTNINLLAAAQTKLPGVGWRQVQHVTDLSTDHDARQAYLYLRQNGRSWAAVAGELPSQFFRRIIAEELKLGEFDWRKDSRPSTVAASLAALQA
jgi:diadenosine tetraphosphate (Ap4A) HIT family hydrolase